MIRKLIKTTSTVLLLICNATFSKAQDWIVYNKSNSGLPDNQVQAITIDKKGVRWIATANGLANFDGKTWNVYNKDNSPLPSSMIRALAADNDENIWVGTDKGLVVFDRIKWTVYNSQNSILVNDAITTIVCDNKRGNLWIGTEKGLIRYDGTNWTRFDDNNSLLIADHIYSIAIDNSGIVWAGTFDHFQFTGRLNRFNGSTWEATKLEQKDLNSSFPRALAIDKNDILWMGINGTTGGALVRVEGNDWQIFNNHTSNNIPAGIQALLTEGGNKWLGTGAGLIAYHGATFKNFNSGNSALPDNYISCIALDRNGNKLIGTIYGGLAVYKEGGVVADTIDQVKFPSLNIYPNPVKSKTTISYTTAEKDRVIINIHSPNGRLLGIIQDKIVDKGNHTITWNAEVVPAGVYFCTLTTSKRKCTRKLLIY